MPQRLFVLFGLLAVLVVSLSWSETGRGAGTTRASRHPTSCVNLRPSFAGANPAPLVQPSSPISTTLSYFYGNDPAGWQPDVPVWSSMRY